jgi:hypothetical protein
MLQFSTNPASNYAYEMLTYAYAPIYRCLYNATFVRPASDYAWVMLHFLDIVEPHYVPFNFDLTPPLPGNPGASHHYA